MSRETSLKLRQNHPQVMIELRDVKFILTGELNIESKVDLIKEDIFFNATFGRLDAEIGFSPGVEGIEF